MDNQIGFSKEMIKKSKRPQIRRRIPEIFTEKDINLIINQALKVKYCGEIEGRREWSEFFKYRNATIIATMYLLALRPNEACCLKFKDFNWKTSTVKIRGENNKTKKDRIIPVPKTLLKFYKVYFSYSRERFWKGSLYLFPSFESDHISPQTFKGFFREKILKPLGLWEMPTEQTKVPKIRLYTLRHSRASHLLKRQIRKHGRPDLFAIKNFLGHEDLRSTQVYLHTDGDSEYMNYLRDEIDL